jgi:hypothetical protein
MTNMATRDQIITAQVKTIFQLMNKAMLASVEADKNADDGEINIAISYLMEIAPLAESIKSLTEATLTIYRTF